MALKPTVFELAVVHQMMKDSSGGKLKPGGLTPRFGRRVARRGRCQRDGFDQPLQTAAAETNQPPDAFCTGESMTTDSVFQRAPSNMLAEIFDSPLGKESYLLNPGDPGLLRQLDTIEASAASKRPMPGKTMIAAHVDHVRFGLSILNRWAAGEANPWAGGDWNPSWQSPQLPRISG